MVAVMSASPNQASTSTANNEMNYDRYYISMPEMNIREAPDKPGAIDTLCAGDEVKLLEVNDIWATFEYVGKDGKEHVGCTWAGAVAPGIRIHLTEDEFIYHKVGATQEDLGMISTWREPTDPDLLILWEEYDDKGQKWFYVMSLEDCRAGYMSGDAKYEIVE